MKKFLFVFLALCGIAGAQTSTLTINTGTGLINIPGGSATPNFAALKVGSVTITPVTYGSGVATFLTTPSSANLAAAMTDETGSGSLVFAGGNVGNASATSLAFANGTAAAPAIKFSSAPTYGWFFDGSTNWRMSNGAGSYGFEIDAQFGDMRGSTMRVSMVESFQGLTSTVNPGNAGAEIVPDSINGYPWYHKILGVTKMTVAGSSITTTVPLTVGGTLTATNPAFYATMSAPQTITASTWTKVAFDTKGYDIGTNYDAVNFKWTPTMPTTATVRITACVYINEFASNNVLVAIYKNGSAFAIFTGFQTKTGPQSYLVTTDDRANGSTDYYEAFVYDDGTALGVVNTANRQWFCGVVIP